jgi:hypothetical protein
MSENDILVMSLVFNVIAILLIGDLLFKIRQFDHEVASLYQTMIDRELAWLASSTHKDETKGESA